MNKTSPWNFRTEQKSPSCLGKEEEEDGEEQIREKKEEKGESKEVEIRLETEVEESSKKDSKDTEKEGLKECKEEEEDKQEEKSESRRRRYCRLCKKVGEYVIRGSCILCKEARRRRLWVKKNSVRKVKVESESEMSVDHLFVYE